MLDTKTIQLRSGCPINLSLEVLGDRWSLIVLRDVIFGGRRHFRALLTESEEGIASNILAARLKRLVALGLLTRKDDPTHRQKGIYTLTEPAIQLVPALAVLGSWGRQHLPVSRELAVRARLLEEGGPSMWASLMDELRVEHLGRGPVAGTPSVLAELQTAFEAEMKKGRTRRGTPR